MNNRINVLKIQRYSTKDGPGIRTTVFLKGCPLRCAWCHNPESIHSTPVVSIKTTLCKSCGLCVSVCPFGVHFMANGVHHINIERCTGCGSCVTACPQNALSILGGWRNLDEVVAVVRKDKAYYERSGGGVTLSGGELMVQWQAVGYLIDALHAEGIAVCLDTSGYAAMKPFSRIARKANLILFDLKVMDDSLHQRVTGVSNASILKNLKWLVRENISCIIRVPLIPGVNTGKENLRVMASFLDEIGFHGQVDLLNFNEFARSKYDSMGREFLFRETLPLNKDELAIVLRELEGRSFNAVVAE